MPDTDAIYGLLEAFSLIRLPQGEVELAGDIPYAVLEPFRARALTEIVRDMELPGFRKGRVPEVMVLARVGETAVLETAVNHLLRTLYPALIAEKQLDAIGTPAIRVSALSPGQPVSLTIRTAIYPSVSIPADFRELASRIPRPSPEPVSDEEYNHALEQLRRSKAAGGADGSGELPALDDAFARSIGSFTTLDQLKEKLREGIAEEKSRSAREKHRSAIMEALLEKTDIDMPAIFTEQETEKMLSQMRSDIARFNLPFADYLTRIGKTEEELREELRPAAEKRAKLHIVLRQIAEQEHIVPEPGDIARDFDHALAHFPAADKDALRAHIETIARNEAVLRMLEAGAE